MTSEKGREKLAEAKRYEALDKSMTFTIL